MPAVWVFGAIHMDLAVTAPHHPRVGETVIGSQLVRSLGGKAANQAVAASRAGVAAGLTARLGDDQLASELRALLAGEGIDLEHTASVAGAPSGVALIVVADAQNTIVIASGANASLDAQAAAGPELSRGDVVVAQLEAPQAVAIAAFERARAVGASTLLNVAPAMPLDARLLEASDVLVLNEVELGLLSHGGEASLATPANVLSAAESLRASPGQTVVVTLGAAGAVAAGPRGQARVEGRPVRALDTTGAGDCFVGYLAAELCRGRPLVAALESANLAASLCVQAPGAAASMPTVAMLEAARAAREPTAGDRAQPAMSLADEQIERSAR